MNFFVSSMRTVVPVVAGLVLALAARAGLDLDGETVTTYVTAAAAAVYYLLWRGLESLAERMAWQPLQVLAGILLGWARPPAYERPVTMPVRLKLDRAAMQEDMDVFVRGLGSRLERPPR